MRMCEGSWWDRGWNRSESGEDVPKSLFHLEGMSHDVGGVRTEFELKKDEGHLSVTVHRLDVSFLSTVLHFVRRVGRYGPEVRDETSIAKEQGERGNRQEGLENLIAPLFWNEDRLSRGIGNETRGAGEWKSGSIFLRDSN